MEQVNLMKKAFEAGLSVVKKIEDSQQENIDQASRLIANAFVNGKKFFVTGSGHSAMATEDFYVRAGGLVFPIPILTSELTFIEHPHKSSLLERLDGYASILAELYPIGQDDVILIVSNSGRNAYPVEMAIRAKEKGAKVIAITNLTASKKSKSRAKSGKLLFEIADVVIDNCGQPGDAATWIEGIDTPMLPTSTIANGFIVQALNVQTAYYIKENNVEPPIFVCPNIMGSTEKNNEYFKKYTRLYK